MLREERGGSGPCLFARIGDGCAGRSTPDKKLHGPAGEEAFICCTFDFLWMVNLARIQQLKGAVLD
jgi:hypothetical protein